MLSASRTRPGSTMKPPSTLNPQFSILNSRFLILFAVWLFVSGATCNTVPAEKFLDTQRQLQTAEEQIKRLEQQQTAQQETIRTLRSRIASLGGVQGDPADVLIVPERIELAGISGGYDDDDQVGDDGLVLYIEPVDRDGHVVKAAGTLSVRLLDPLSPPDRLEFGSYKFDWDHTREKWYGRLWTHHFRVKCPWPEGRLPAHNEIIAHAVFTELITGRSLTASRAFKIALPADHSAGPVE